VHTVPDSPVVIDPANAGHYVIFNRPNATGIALNGVRVGDVSPLRNFVPLAPGRVFDSRWAIFGATRVAGGQNLQINVSHRRTLDGTLDLLNFVPAGASAITFKLAITDTVGQGFLAITPGDAAGFGAASINWFGGNQALNNGTVSSLDTNRLVRVWCGGSVDAQTHMIIDVTSYFICGRSERRHPRETGHETGAKFARMRPR
jgi:hypothetical protein